MENLKNIKRICLFFCIGLLDMELYAQEISKDTLRLNEQIEMGYTSVSRNSLTGAVSTVSGKQLEKVPVANLSLLLAGQLSGLTTIENGSELSRGGACISVAFPQPTGIRLWS